MTVHLLLQAGKREGGKKKGHFQLQKGITKRPPALSLRLWGFLLDGFQKRKELEERGFGERRKHRFRA